MYKYYIHHKLSKQEAQLTETNNAVHFTLFLSDAPLSPGNLRPITVLTLYNHNLWDTVFCRQYRYIFIHLHAVGSKKTHA